MKTKEIFKTVYDRRKLFNFETNYYLTQLFTGHNSTGEYLYRFKLKDTDKCTMCHNQVDDTKHRFENCPIYQVERNEFKFKIESIGKIWPVDVKELMAEKETQLLLKCFTEQIFAQKD